MNSSTDLNLHRKHGRLSESRRYLEIEERFTDSYLEVLSSLSDRGPRSFGFEYEFIPQDPLALPDMENLFRYFTDIGFRKDKNEFVSSFGLRVTFEPGGQIEYLSPPLPAEDERRFDSLLHHIDEINRRIQSELGIRYLATGYLPGRGGKPLCLTTERYVNLQARLSKSGTRGLEMMKGTASIHLHVKISEHGKLLPLFQVLCRLATSDAFKMSTDRKYIWEHTDPTRCGLPPCCFAELQTPRQLIQRLVRFALNAKVLGEEAIFPHARDQSFKAFLYHMTTIFTDVRFNLKGPTLELRTLDSIPSEQFREKWRRFVSILNDV